MKPLILIVLAATMTFIAVSLRQEPLRSVAFVDPAKILGLWYDYAAIPDETSAQCGQNKTQQFFFDSASHQIHFRSTCYTLDGKKVLREGHVNTKNSTSLAHFQMSSTEFWGHPIFLTSKQYDVIGLDGHYRWMVVGHPSLKSGWIYSRSRQLPTRELMKIKNILENSGYDLCDFYTFPSQILEMRKPLCHVVDQTHLY